MLIPRIFLRCAWLTLFLIAAAASASLASPFVTVDGRHFVRDGRPWYVCGTNLWYGAALGRPSNPAGRERLVRELDRLQSLGVNNLRLLGASEDCTVANTTKPAISRRPGVYDEDLLRGLDFVVAEAGRRHMTVVLFLNNYWDWSGGIPQYLSWATGKPAQGLADLPWKQWNRLQSTFYTNHTAQELNRRYMAMLLGRANTVSGIEYRKDSAIMAWELANEPRPGERDGENAAVLQAFIAWVESTSAFLKSLDPQHLVTTGSEGEQGCLYSDENFRRVHAVKTIDYAVFHLWPKNWRWFDYTHPAETIGPTLAKAAQYIGRHLASAATLGKPVVLEEFGLDRDGEPAIATGVASRDRFYRMAFKLLEQSATNGGPAAGSNFWLWGGEGRPPRPGDPPAADGIGAGDMIQEPAGLNTVFDCDHSTLAIIHDHFAVMTALSRQAPPEKLAANPQ